ncbi:MAG: c-type cytochrome domain-containing protein [Planctomycetota bacterium]
MPIPLLLSLNLKLQDRLPGFFGCTICLWLAIGVPCGQSLLAQEAAESEGSEESLRHFEQEIRPLLISKCISCHGESKKEGGLRLDSHEAFLTGGESGSLLGDSSAGEDSLLLEALRYESIEMPPTGPLS